ncbi:ubiquitin-protein transferase [Aureococcus anophagefferens]|nr:ubiquitin-protein transferase [Aureococcus anophagefferens]
MIAAYRSRLGARVVALVGAERELPAPADWESSERCWERSRGCWTRRGPDARRRRAAGPARGLRDAALPAARALVEAGASRPAGSSEALNIIEALIEREADRAPGGAGASTSASSEDPDSDAGDVENPLRRTPPPPTTTRACPATSSALGPSSARSRPGGGGRRRRAPRRAARDADARRATDEERATPRARSGASRTGRAAAAAVPAASSAQRLRQRATSRRSSRSNSASCPTGDAARAASSGPASRLEEPAVQSATHAAVPCAACARASSVGTLLFFFLCFG